jgi:hypothetical protein
MTPRKTWLSHDEAVCHDKANKKKSFVNQFGDPEHEGFSLFTSSWQIW